MIGLRAGIQAAALAGSQTGRLSRGGQDPIAEGDDLGVVDGRLGAEQVIAEVERQAEVEGPDQSAGGDVVGHQRAAGQRDAVAVDRRLDRQALSD